DGARQRSSLTLPARDSARIPARFPVFLFHAPRERRACFMTPKQIVLTVSGAVAGALLIVTLILCVRPYDVPEFIEVDSSESAFLIPLEGDTSSQAAFQSVEFLKEKKVAAK